MSEKEIRKDNPPSSLLDVPSLLSIYEKDQDTQTRHCVQIVVLFGNIINFSESDPHLDRSTWFFFSCRKALLFYNKYTLKTKVLH